MEEKKKKEENKEKIKPNTLTRHRHLHYIGPHTKNKANGHSSNPIIMERRELKLGRIKLKKKRKNKQTQLSFFVQFGPSEDWYTSFNTGRGNRLRIKKKKKIILLKLRYKEKIMGEATD